DRIPHRAAAAVRRHAAAPGARRLAGQHVVGGGAVRLPVRVGGRVEAPVQLAGGRVVGRQIAAHAVLGAALADQHLAVGDARRAGDRVRLGRIGHLHGPDRLAGRRVQRDQLTGDGADVDLAVPDRDAAVDHVAARLEAVLAGHLGVERPLRLAGRRVVRIDLRPGGGGVERAVHYQRRRLLAALGVELRVPGEAELADVAGVDLVERAEALFGVGTP